MNSHMELKRWFCLALVFFSAGLAFAEPTKTYVNKMVGFSVSYPKAWYVNDRGSRIDIFSAEDAYNSEAAGAGISIILSELDVADEGSPAQALERVIRDSGNPGELGAAVTRIIGGKEWYSVPFSSSADQIEGEYDVLIKGVNVIVIGSFFKLSDSRTKFQPAVDGVFASFKFPALVYRLYQNKAKGASFRCPDYAEVKESGDNLLCLIGGNDPGGLGSGAVITIGSFDANGDEFKGKDEKGVFEFFKTMESETIIVKEPEPVTLLKMTWTRGEIAMEGGRVILYVKKTGALFFGIVFLVRPEAAMGDYQAIFDTFLKSLSLDMKKWAASLHKE